jgi:hypothetical protein
MQIRKATTQTNYQIERGFMMVNSQEALRVKKRLEALKRGGVHRVKEQNPMPSAVHVAGIGKAGAEFIAQMIKQAPDDFLTDSRKRFTALAVDIGNQDLQQIEALADHLPSEQSQVRTVSLPVPSRDELFGSLRRYREYLKLEYPRYYWNLNYEPWLPDSINISQAGEHFPRAIAKAIYGKAYYDGDQPLEKELDDFAKSIDKTKLPSMVLCCFALGDGTGSGIVVDLARHLSNVKLGRRIPVVGVGELPCSGDPDTCKDGSLFATFNEIDCMLDDDKNAGVTTVWGDLYRNPFTGGFFALATENSYQRLSKYTDTGVPSERDRMRLQVTHKFVADAFILKEGSQTDYAECIIHAPREMWNDKLDEKFKAVVSTFLVESEDSTLNINHSEFFDHLTAFADIMLPGVAKVDFVDFFKSRDLYDTLTWEQKLLHHSWLMDLGVMMSEPAIRFEGMAGECLWGCACWIVVPYEEIRGDAPVPINRRDILEKGIAPMTKTVVPIPATARAVAAI